MQSMGLINIFKSLCDCSDIHIKFKEWFLVSYINIIFVQLESIKSDLFNIILTVLDYANVTLAKTTYTVGDPPCQFLHGLTDCGIATRCVMLLNTPISDHWPIIVLLSICVEMNSQFRFSWQKINNLLHFEH